jgi:hypothetical protein
MQYFKRREEFFEMLAVEVLDLKERLNKNILFYNAKLTAKNKRKHLIGRHSSATHEGGHSHISFFNSDTSCIFMTLFTRFMTNKRENINV